MALVLACGTYLPTGASAAPPANDAFASPQALSGSLPIFASGSNVEATKELGEPGPGSFDFEPAGHSVWFSWEATVSEWVTVATCGSTFDTLLDVYRGNAFFDLEKVASRHEGPGFGCAPGGSQITFRAVAGESYRLRVDGNLSPQPPDPVEGGIFLRIEKTPVPPNDDFAAAQQVTSESLDGGLFHRVDVPGFNWKATKEAGEPAHGGYPGGASVWYSWTAPISGVAKVRVVTGLLPAAVGVYTGESLTALTPIGAPVLYSNEVDAPVTAGSTYRIAVDGQTPFGSDLPWMGQFTFLIYLEAPGRAPVGEGQGPTFTAPIPDLVSPQTNIFSRQVKRVKRSATFTFRSSEASTFRCKLDGRKASACRSPKSYSGLGPGGHTFKVYAVDAAGNADATPAVARFAIAGPQPRPR